MDIQLLRTLLNDTDESNYLLTDEQYEAIAGLETNVYNAAALCARSIAAQNATKKKTNVRGISVENQQIYEHYMELAKEYDYRASQGAGYVDTEGKGVSGFCSPIVTGISVKDVVEAKNDRDRVQNVFPKPESDVV